MQARARLTLMTTTSLISTVLAVPVRAVARAYMASSAVLRGTDAPALARDAGLGLVTGAATAVACAGTAAVALKVAPAAAVVGVVGLGLVAMHSARCSRAPRALEV